MVGINELLK